ncbi:MAG: radical SAM protein [Aquihabitans sp.]
MIGEKPICRAPSVSLHLDPLGAVRACCMSPWFVLGRIGEQTLQEIWAGPRAEELRARLAAGDLSAGCDACRGPIEAGRPEAAFARTFDELPLDRPEPHRQWPAQLELALSNTCNLQCVMCNGTLSSAIRAGREGLGPLPTVYDDAFFEELAAFLAHVERISILGGEPFLARETWRIIDLLRASGNRAHIQVTTNGTIWNQRVEDLLGEFPCDVAVSIDALEPDTMRSIRIGIDPDKVWQTVDRLRELAPRSGGSVSIAHCLMPDNWRELHPFLRRADELDLDVFLNDVTWPTPHAIGALPPAELAAISATWDEQLATAPALGRNRGVFARAQAKVADLAARTGVAVAPPQRRGPGRVRFRVDHLQRLTDVSPSPTDVFGVDISGVIGHPVGEWMERFSAVHGHLSRSSVSRTDGGEEHWSLDITGPLGSQRLTARFRPFAEGGGAWDLDLTPTEDVLEAR